MYVLEVNGRISTTATMAGVSELQTPTLKMSATYPETRRLAVAKNSLSRTRSWAIGARESGAIETAPRGKSSDVFASLSPDFSERACRASYGSGRRGPVTDPPNLDRPGVFAVFLKLNC